MFEDLKDKINLDDVKGKVKDALAQHPQASGQWINGQFVPNPTSDPIQQASYQQPQYQGDISQQPYQQSVQQPMEQPVPQQYQQPVQQIYQQPVPQQYQQPVPQQYQQPMQQPYQQQMPYQQPVQQFQQPVQQQGGIMCPKCKGRNVNVQMVEVGSTTKTKKSGVGLGGHAHNAARAGAAMMTLGMSNLVVKKATGTEKGKTKTKNEKYCICQNCGNSWKIK